MAILIGAVALGGGAYYLWDVSGASPPEPPKIGADGPARSGSSSFRPQRRRRLSRPLPRRSPNTTPRRPSRRPPPTRTRRKRSKPRPHRAPPRPKPPRPCWRPPTARPRKQSPKWRPSWRRRRRRSNASPSGCKRSKANWRRRKTTRAPRFRRAMRAPAKSGASAARLVVAQSLLSALRQGDDYSAQLAALQNFGVDPARLAPLRAGLSRTGRQPARRLVRRAGAQTRRQPPRRPTPRRRPSRPRTRAVRSWASSRWRRTSWCGSARPARQTRTPPRPRSTRSRRICAPAISPPRYPPASSCPLLRSRLSADWATAAQTRLDAEAAAKAELAQALQDLAKTKS